MFTALEAAIAVAVYIYDYMYIYICIYICIYIYIQIVIATFYIATTKYSTIINLRYLMTYPNYAFV